MASIFSCIADMMGYTSGGFIFKLLGVKKTQLLGQTIALAGALMLLFVGLQH